MKVITIRQLMLFLDDTFGDCHSYMATPDGVMIANGLGVIVGVIPLNIIRDLNAYEPFIPLRGVSLLMYNRQIIANDLIGYTYILD